MRFLALSLVATAALADTAATPAPAPQQATNPHLAAAQRLYQRLDLDAALAELNQAEAAARDNEDELAQVLIYRGLIFAETGKTSESQDQFKRALAMRPWAEVPPETSPRLAKAFSDARRSIWGSSGIKPPPKKKVSAVPAAAPTPAPEKPAESPAKPADANPAK